MTALGATRLRALAGDLDGRVTSLLSAVAEDVHSPDVLIRRTHRDRGAAGTLGLLALADALAHLEQALAHGGGGGATVAAVSEAHFGAAHALTSALDAVDADQAAVRPSR